MSERPRNITDEMKRAAAEKVVNSLIGSGFLSLVEMQNAIADIVSVGRMREDGYELAKSLEERKYWDCNLQMANEIDAYSDFCQDALRQAEKDWVREFPQTPPFPPGTRIKLNRSVKTGVIDGVYEYGAAQYTVAIDGDPAASGPSKSRRIVNFEDVSALAEAAV